VRPRRRKALRQGGRGQDWKIEDKRASDRFEIGKRQYRFRDSREGFVQSDVDYYQDRYSDRYWEDSEVERRRFEARRRAWVHHRREERAARGIMGTDRRDSGRGKGHETAANIAKNDSATGPQFRRFVTFYFTNFPPQLSNFYLRKGFEVCGMLEEVVVPSKCNASGERYGFV